MESGSSISRSHCPLKLPFEALQKAFKSKNKFECQIMEE